MPPKKTGKKKQISYASVSLSAGKGVGSDLDEELLALPTLKTSRGMLALANDKSDPEIDESAHLESNLRHKRSLSLS